MKESIEKKIDGLTTVVADGFKRMDEGFQNMDEFGEAVSDGFSSVERKITKLNDKIDFRTNAITNRLDDMVDDMRTLKTSNERSSSSKTPFPFLSSK